MLDTVLRQIEILRSLPRYPRRIAITGIRAKLVNAGHDVTIRTIQRDLLALSHVLPITGDEQKPQGWSWAGEPIQIPALDPQGALTLKLVELFLAPLLPKTTLSALEPHFKAAQGILSASPKLARWTQKVRVLPRGLALNPPKIDPEVQSVVYESLFQEKQVRLHYCPKGEVELKEYVANPLGIVIRNQVIYLICTLWRYEDVLQLALHRIKNAELLAKRALRPKRFDLDEYIRKGEFGYPLSEKPIRLRAIFDRGASLHLHETPLSLDQVLTPYDDDHEQLEATVLDTSELRWWLLGFGSGAEVLEPKSLRAEFATIATDMANLYKNGIIPPTPNIMS